MATVAARASRSCTTALAELLYGRNSQNQMVLVVMSIGRLHWNWNEAHHPRGPAIANGRLTRAKTAPVPARNPAPTRARRRG